MIAKIYDERNIQINRIEGNFNDNQFWYREGGLRFVIPIISYKVLLFGKEKNFGCDYKLTLKDGGEKVAYYQYDGKDYHQMAFMQLVGDANNATVKDYINTSEKADYIIDSALPKPVFQALAQYVVPGIFLISALLYLMASNNLQQASVNYSAPLNATIHKGNIAQAVSNNETLKLNETLVGLNRTMYACIQRLA